MKANNLVKDRRPCKASKKRKKTTAFNATGINQVWTWEITYFRDSKYPTKFYYAYVIVDIYSRKIVHSKVYNKDCSNCGFYSKRGFDTQDKANEWLAQYVEIYNTKHYHHGIKMLTPEDKHRSKDAYILEQRKAIIQGAKNKNPRRWINNKIADFSVVNNVWLNPGKDECLMFN